jgi:hypothetical protein
MSTDVRHWRVRLTEFVVLNPGRPGRLTGIERAPRTERRESVPFRDCAYPSCRFKLCRRYWSVMVA